MVVLSILLHSQACSDLDPKGRSGSLCQARMESSEFRVRPLALEWVVTFGVNERVEILRVGSLSVEVIAPLEQAKLVRVRLVLVLLVYKSYSFVRANMSFCFIVSRCERKDARARIHSLKRWWRCKNKCLRCFGVSKNKCLRCWRLRALDCYRSRTSLVLYLSLGATRAATFSSTLCLVLGAGSSYWNSNRKTKYPFLLTYL